METKFTPAERREFAAIAGISPEYLYQCLTGLKDMAPVRAKRLEAATNRRIRVWDVCPNDWREIWPELEELSKVKAEAPTVEEAGHEQ